MLPCLQLLSDVSFCLKRQLWEKNYVQASRAAVRSRYEDRNSNLQLNCSSQQSAQKNGVGLTTTTDVATNMRLLYGRPSELQLLLRIF